MLMLQVLPGMWRGLLAALAATLGSVFGRVRMNRRTSAAATESRLAQVLRAAGGAIHECHPETGAARSIVGPIDHIAGWTSEEWRTIGPCELIHPDDLDGYLLDGANLRPGEVLDRVVRFRHRDGGWVWLREVSHAERLPDGSMAVSGLTLDVTNLTEALAAAEFRGAYDQLTGLPNRFTFMRRLESHLVARDDIALFMLDLNRFRDINDVLTHAVGDELLVELAMRLRAEARPTDVVARLSGDQFGVLLLGSGTVEDTAWFAEHVAAVLEQPVVVQGTSIAASISIGTARSGDDPIDAEMMMRWADTALADAKRQRRSHRAFSVDLETATVRDLVLSASVPEALANGEIVAHFQPKVDLATGRIVSAEALVRWNHPEHGLLGASSFVNLIRLGSHASRFTDAMIDDGLAAIASCQAIGRPISVAVNVAVRSMIDVGFPDRVERMCRAHGVQPAQLILELTEDELMEMDGMAPTVMARLRSIGVELSIDDFGAGYSSFSRLPGLPISEIKVDRRFVAAAQDDGHHGVILSSIVQLGRNLGLRVVVEGVETSGQADVATALGAHVAQGFRFGRAMPIEELIDELLDGAISSV